MKKRFIDTKTALAGVLGLLAIAGGAWRFQHETAVSKQLRAAHSAAGARAQDADSEPTLVDVEGPSEAWEIGSRRVYHADYSTAVEREHAVAGGSITFAGTAELQLTVESLRPEHVILQGQLSDASIVADTSTGQVKPGDLGASIKDELTRPFKVRMSRDGRVVTVAMDPQTNSLAQGIVRTLLGALQFVEPPGPNPSWKQWSVEESDMNGVYKAGYQQVAQGQFRKSKLEYQHLEAASRMGDANAHAKVASKITILRRASGVIEHVESDEIISVPFGDSSFKTTSHVKLELTGLGRGALAVMDARRLVESPLFSAAPEVKTTQSELQRKRDLVAGATFEQLASDLSKLSPSKENFSQRWNVTQRMSALFELDPGSIGAAASRVKGGASENDKEMLLAALSDANLPEAQTALADLAHDPGVDTPTRSASATHLGLLKNPTPETLARLQNMANNESDPEVKGAATLALGGASRASREADPGSGEKDTSPDLLLQKLGSAQTPAERRLYIDALGNSGDPRGLPAIQGALTDPDPTLRAAAVSALRFMPGPEIDGLIVATLTRDPEQLVRSAALSTLRSRPASDVLTAGAVAALKIEPFAGLRVELIQVLLRFMQVPGVHETLEWVAKNDASPEVKAAAQTALSPTPNAPPAANAQPVPAQGAPTQPATPNDASGQSTR
jgi:HEAT repeat protein